MEDVKRTETKNGREHHSKIEVESSKSKATYTIVKANNGFIFFEIKQSKGALPKELSGFFSSQEEAEKTINKFFSNKPESRAVRRDRVYKENHS